MTAQIGENLRYLGEDLTMATEPLESYFAMGGQHPGFEAYCTALHRGYVGSWEIAGERLYLVELTATLEGGTRAGLDSVFPGFPDRVFAHWYSGTLRIPQGSRLRYVHGGYLSVYERDVMIEIERGVIRRSWVRDNAAGPSDERAAGEGLR